MTDLLARAAAMRQTAETRSAILALKAARALDTGLRCPSIDLYRAVLDDGVRTVEELRA